MNNFNNENGYYSSARGDMLDFVSPKARRVLDVGCGEGNFARLVKENLQAEVWGVEIQPTAAEIARTKIDRVIVGDFESAVEELPMNYFDCIIFNDILEHLIDPWAVLEVVKRHLCKNGLIVASIPNVRHFSTLFELLVKKDWAYKDSGVLDRTHLRFFTKKSIVRMFDDSGYTIIELKGLGQTKSPKYKVINSLLLNTMSDAKYLKFACVARVK